MDNCFLFRSNNEIWDFECLIYGVLVDIPCVLGPIGETLLILCRRAGENGVI